MIITVIHNFGYAFWGNLIELNKAFVKYISKIKPSQRAMFPLAVSICICQLSHHAAPRTLNPLALKKLP